MTAVWPLSDRDLLSVKEERLRLMSDNLATTWSTSKLVADFKDEQVHAERVRPI